ncbi:MAG: hypothetical protein NT070_18275 [Cyanobacteria bacterium]|nr:hypothetical protein [Cyanobacteriota bacterium]
MKNAVLTVILMMLIKMLKTMNATTIAPKITAILMMLVQIKRLCPVLL